MKRPQAARQKGAAVPTEEVEIRSSGTKVPTQAEFLAAIEPMGVAVAGEAKRRFADGAPLVAAFGRMMAAAGAYRARHGAWPLPTGIWVFNGEPFRAVGPTDAWRMLCWALAIEAVAGVADSAEGGGTPCRRAAKGGE